LPIGQEGQRLPGLDQIVGQVVVRPDAALDPVPLGPLAAPVPGAALVDGGGPEVAAGVVEAGPAVGAAGEDLLDRVLGRRPATGQQVGDPRQIGEVGGSGVVRVDRFGPVAPAHVT
jgi:hypothetical protein